jgi:hypothetical protein
MAELPAGARIMATNEQGESEWASPLCIDVKLEDGSRKKYFLKESDTMIFTPERLI